MRNMPIQKEFDCTEVTSRAGAEVERLVLEPVVAPAETDEWRLDEGIECLVLWAPVGTMKLGKRYRLTIEEVRQRRKLAGVEEPETEVELAPGVEVVIPEIGMAFKTLDGISAETVRQAVASYDGCEPGEIVLRLHENGLVVDSWTWVPENDGA